jgi:hypothetical protein
MNTSNDVVEVEYGLTSLYENVYEPIYETSYSVSFVFLEEDQQPTSNVYYDDNIGATIH